MLAAHITLISKTVKITLDRISQNNFGQILKEQPVLCLFVIEIIRFEIDFLFYTVQF